MTMLISRLGLRRVGSISAAKTLFTYRVHSTGASPAAVNNVKTEDETGAPDVSSPPKLVEIPSLPFFGSFISQISGIPTMDQTKIFDFWPEMRRRCGDFYKMGVPGMGEGSHGTAYFINDPKQMMKVLKAEGKFPSGGVENTWPNKKYFEHAGSAFFGIFGRGEEWKRVRTFLQTDLLSPESARGYVPAIIKAAEHASRGAPVHRNNLNRYLHHCAFDMFNAVMLGELSRVAESGKPSDPENELFCQSIVTALSLSNFLLLSPYETIMNKLGIETANYKKIKSNWDITLEIAHRKVNNFIERKKKGELNEDELSSYLSRAVDRQVAEKSNISEIEMREICSGLLAAAVDTTSGLIAWNLLHISQNPEAQERLYDELSAAVASDGRLSVDMFPRSTSPYLHAVVRESNRLSLPVQTNMMKRLASDIEVHGIRLLKGSVVVFDSYSLGMDPNFVDDPEEFRPERWLPDAVAARKGTKAEVIDHPFFEAPFSQGARRCPGSRVAANELQVLLAQLVLDWKFSSPVKTWRDVPYDLEIVTTPKLPRLEFVRR